MRFSFEEISMSVIPNTDLPRSSLPGLENVTLAGSDNGLRHLSVWQQMIAPGTATPPHRHDCEEVVLIRSGSGELHLDGEVHRFGPDTTLIIPPGAPHQLMYDGAAPFELIGIFSVSPVVVFSTDGQPIELPWAT
jgi:mannose-6-phosphate isomerase-like protein (cupin superfamily)